MGFELLPEYEKHSLVLFHQSSEVPFLIRKRLMYTDVLSSQEECVRPSAKLFYSRPVRNEFCSFAFAELVCSMDPQFDPLLVLLNLKDVQVVLAFL